jgi:hypothetical protein
LASRPSNHDPRTPSRSHSVRPELQDSPSPATPSLIYHHPVGIPGAVVRSGNVDAVSSRIGARACW